MPCHACHGLSFCTLLSSTRSTTALSRRQATRLNRWQAQTSAHIDTCQLSPGFRSHIVDPDPDDSQGKPRLSMGPRPHPSATPQLMPVAIPWPFLFFLFQSQLWVPNSVSLALVISARPMLWLLACAPLALDNCWDCGSSSSLAAKLDGRYCRICLRGNP